MGSGWAAIVEVLDAFPFALGLGIVLLHVGETLDPGRLLAISVLLAVGVGTLLARPVVRRRDHRLVALAVE